MMAFIWRQDSLFEHLPTRIFLGTQLFPIVQRSLLGHLLKVLPFVQCDPEEKDACDAGCGGGLMTNAYNYVMEAGGLESESDYPYKGSNGKCKYDSNKIAAKVTNFTNIPIDEDQMAAYLVHQGPLAG
jgi:cathepsin F